MGIGCVVVAVVGAWDGVSETRGLSFPTGVATGGVADQQEVHHQGNDARCEGGREDGQRALMATG